MRVVFYSERCEHSKKLLAYIEKNNIMNLFKLFNIDTNMAPKEIDIVPTIVDSEINQPLKGKKAFEYLINLKYFNNPTNNIELVKEIPPNPDIKEDDMAIDNENNISSQLNSKLDKEINMNIINNPKPAELHKEQTVSNVNTSTQKMVNLRQGQDKRFMLLMQMRK